MEAIEIKNLRKSFIVKKGPLFKKKKELFEAVKGVNLTINRGEIFSLLGPNGAGKTTTIKMLSTLLIPSEGSASVMGYDIVKDAKNVRRVLSTVLPGERTLYWKLTIKENLQYFADLYGLNKNYARKRANELMERFGVDDKKNDLVEKLSTGQRQKAVLIRALLPNPDVLLLDEPTLGLDPNAAINLREIIKEIRQEFDTTILLTTHYMYEADELSDRVAIINDGTIEALDTPEKLKLGLGTKQILRMSVLNWNNEAVRALNDKWKINEVKVIDENEIQNIQVEFKSEEVLLGQVAKLCSDNNVTVHGMKMDSPTLEDVFIHKTGKALEEAKL